MEFRTTTVHSVPGRIMKPSFGGRPRNIIYARVKPEQVDMTPEDYDADPLWLRELSHLMRADWVQFSKVHLKTRLLY